jgi:hypothetical protein
MVWGSVLMATYLICNMKRLTIQTPVTCLSAKLIIPCYLPYFQSSLCPPEHFQLSSVFALKKLSSVFGCPILCFWNSEPLVVFQNSFDVC